MQNIQDKKRFIKKICLLGDGGVGKTSLILKYVKHSFPTEWIKTIGAVVYKKEIELKDTIIDLVIWDIAGQETFDGIRLAYFRGADGAFVVCDCSREETYLNLEEWVNSLYKVQRNVPIVFLANKSDLAEKKIDEEKMKLIANKYKAEYFFTSAKEGINVNDAFNLLSQKVIKI